MAQQSYLSVNRFLSGGFGIQTDMSRAALRNTLMRATTLVNRYCATPSIPQAFDFRGGTVTGEQHQWPYVPPLLIREGSRRVYLNQRPIQEVTGFQLQLAENYFVTLDPATNVVVNRMAGYAEIVAIAPVISGYFPIGWNFGLWNPLAIVDYTYGWSFDVVGDECESETTVLYTASYGNWVGAPVVYIDDVEVSSSEYTYRGDDGSIRFTGTAPAPQQVVTVDYTYSCPDAISQATGLIATNLIGESRLAARGMIGLRSIRIAEVALTQMSPGEMTSRNGVSIPVSAANMLNGFTMGSIG